MFSHLHIYKYLSLNEGAILFPTFKIGGWRWKRYVHSGLFDNNKKIIDYSTEEWNNLIYAEQIKLSSPSPEWHKTAKYEGIIPRFERTFLRGNSKSSNESYTEEIQNIIKKGCCPSCKGTRLNPIILSCKIDKYNIADCCQMRISDLYNFINNIDITSVQPVLESITKFLAHLNDIGLGYLSLDRETSTLSGGESQRVKMIKHLGSSLTDLVYIFDEPSVGLHPADVNQLNKLIKELKEKGNTLLIVEHDPEVISIADHIVDIGPLAGKSGGEICFQGNWEELKRSDTLTGKYLSIKPKINLPPRIHKGYLELEHINKHNLKDVSIKIPKGVLTVVTGVAGSGKSTLIDHALLEKYPNITLIDQSSLHASKRSNISSHTQVLEPIRTLFAKEHKVSPSLFSTNSQGACPECKGLGIIKTDLAFMDSVINICDRCNGSGFKEEVLLYKLRNKNINEALLLTVEDALDFFTESNILGILNKLSLVGLNYITLKQSLNTFSGGERQRVKLAMALDYKEQIYVFDEPTTGLHPADIEKLTNIFNTLLKNNCTIIIVEHNLSIISQADWVIDVGPGGGLNGGHIVFEGVLSDLINNPQTLTEIYLKKYLSYK